MKGDLRAMERSLVEQIEALECARHAVSQVSDFIADIEDDGVTVDVKVDGLVITLDLSLPGVLPGAAMKGPLSPPRPEPEEAQQSSGPLHPSAETQCVDTPKSGARWTEAELATAKTMFLAGHSIEDIAAQLGRPVPGTHYKIRRMRAQWEREATPDLPDAAAPPVSGHTEGSDGEAAATKPDRNGSGQGGEAIHHNAEAAGAVVKDQTQTTDDAPRELPFNWSDELDRDLVRLVTQRASPATMAAAIGCSVDQVRQRRRELVPSESVNEAFAVLHALSGGVSV